MSFTITDDKNKPLFIGTSPVTVGTVKVYPPVRISTREIARQSVENFNSSREKRERRANTKSIGERIKARFTK